MLPTPLTSPVDQRIAHRKRACIKTQDRRIGKFVKDLADRLVPEEEKERRLEFDEELHRERVATSRIFVGNLTHGVTHKTLARVFKVCGPIERVTVSCLTYREDSTCYAEITFNDPNASIVAADLNGLLMEGRALVVCHRRAELPEWRLQRQSINVAEN